MKKALDRLSLLLVSTVLGVTGCINTAAEVRQQDLDAWVGQPVIALELHPVFITMPVVKTTASDGTQIWNYVNGRGVGNCLHSGSILGAVDYATYLGFNNCMAGFAACNNIFYIRDSRIMKYTPVGTGGLRCYTDESLQPNANAPADIR